MNILVAGGAGFIGSHTCLALLLSLIHIQMCIRDSNQSLHILKNDGYFDVYNLMSEYIEDINKGAVWADQDLKSSNHFYSPKTKRGLYGNSNAKNECESYYNRALNEFVSVSYTHLDVYKRQPLLDMKRNSDIFITS